MHVVNQQLLIIGSGEEGWQGETLRRAAVCTRDAHLRTEQVALYVLTDVRPLSMQKC